MGNLVEQLRQRLVKSKYSDLYNAPVVRHAEYLMNEAADEIERLRNALKAINDNLGEDTYFIVNKTHIHGHQFINEVLSPS